MKRSWGFLVLSVAATLTLTGSATATPSVSYTQGGSLWLSSLNGKQKRKDRKSVV